MGDVRDSVLAGDAQFWPGKTSAIITEVHEFPRKNVLHFWLAGGNMIELVEQMVPCAEAWGRTMGCTGFTISGRQGWGRVMASKGYEPKWFICAKDDA